MWEAMHDFTHLLGNFQQENSRSIDEIFDLAQKVILEYDALYKENNNLKQENEALKKELHRGNPL